MSSDRFRRAYLEAVFHRLQGPEGIGIRKKAEELIALWDTQPHADPYYAIRWRQLLAMPLPAMRAVVLASTEEGERLRHTQPFAGVLSEDERKLLLRASAA
jgi:hypothetical protein